MIEFVIAYGGFSENIGKDMSLIITKIIPHLCAFWVLILSTYFISQKFPKAILIAVLVYLLISAFVWPSLGVMGAYGPAHVASHISARIWLFATVIILSMPLVTYIKKKTKKQ
ncbi:MAG: hypothetical protein HRT88_22005 [Lentisphaeraceae bacterium]|nr:hypothetical protein [Lentisphaeraceae bacterium]